MWWERVKPEYLAKQLTEEDFDINDKRDKNEEGIPFGQQVMLCVDEADILLKNDDPFPDEPLRIRKLKDKIKEYVDLLSGELRPPYDDEFNMSLAYTASLKSQCIKRQVGAVIVDERGNVLSVGYNENIPPLKPCIHDPGECERDIYKRDYFGKLKSDKQPCPKCNKPLDFTSQFKCKKCNFDLDEYFIPDKALTNCSALHAEERALNSIQNGGKGTTLYTTASPCKLCGVKISNSGIKKVVYGEAYTDTTALTKLKEKEVDAFMFEGIKARAYFRLFSNWREQFERKMRNGSV
jgi:deoxycytidylate deaminase